MTIEQYWAILLKRWKLVVACFVLVGLGAYIGSKLMTPLYQSSVLVLITANSSSTSNNQLNYDNLLASEQLVQTEASLATSNSVLREVASHYPGLTIDQLSQEVSSTPRTNTQLFEIDVVDPSPIRASSLANDVAAILIKQQLEMIAQDNNQSQQQLQRELAQTQQKISAITTKIAALQSQGGNLDQVTLLQGQLSGLQQHYNQWQAALAQLELTQAQSGNFLHIVQPAHPAGSPVQPKVLVNTVGGLVLGLLLGMLLVVVFERLDTRVRTEKEISQLLDWPVLATIWRTDPSKQEHMINPTGREANVEAYRILRSNIGFSTVDKLVRTLVVTSPQPQDGKSVVAANLAISMAKAGKNTLLIDADLRHPTQHELFGLPAHKMGFSNAVLAFSMPASANTPAYQVLTPMPSPEPVDTHAVPKTPALDSFVHAADVPNLCVMPSGPLPPNPADLLDSKAMQRFLVALASCGAELVIFDSPPLLGLSDTSILASKTDGTIVVVDITHANKGKLKQVRALLQQAGVHVLGYAVNKKRRSRKDILYSDYYYSSGNSRDEKNRRKEVTRSAAILPVTPDNAELSQKQPQQDRSDNTVKLVRLQSSECPSQAALTEPNTLETEPLHPARTERLDGRKVEQQESVE